MLLCAVGVLLGVRVQPASVSREAKMVSYRRSAWLSSALGCLEILPRTSFNTNKQVLKQLGQRDNTSVPSRNTPGCSRKQEHGKFHNVHLKKYPPHPPTRTELHCGIYIVNL